MNMKLTGLVAILFAFLSPSIFAHDNYGNTIAAGNTGHKILFRCSTQVGITLASTTVRDNTPINATPGFSVRIGKANSATNCNAASNWTAVKTVTTEGAWSARTTDISVNQTPNNNYYCLDVARTGAALADDYRVNSHCEITKNDINHQSSTFIGVFPY
ncbi:MAG: hypothetical protein HOO93_08315 [Methyloglobulus sp.]|nr:hypothetical protein [Methyloglobulus sp.]NOU21780.1 hypothetical protein [Methyloglobulus sp.]